MEHKYEYAETGKKEGEGMIEKLYEMLSKEPGMTCSMEGEILKVVHQVEKSSWTISVICEGESLVYTTCVYKGPYAKEAFDSIDGRGYEMDVAEIQYVLDGHKVHKAVAFDTKSLSTAMERFFEFIAYSMLETMHLYEKVSTCEASERLN